MLHGVLFQISRRGLDHNNHIDHIIHIHLIKPQVAAADAIVSFTYVGSLEKVPPHRHTHVPATLPPTHHLPSHLHLQVVLATRDGDFFTANCNNGSAQFDIAGSIEVPIVACQWADDGDVCAVATGVPSVVMLTKEFDVVGECEDG